MAVNSRDRNSPLKSFSINFSSTNTWNWLNSQNNAQSLIDAFAMYLKFMQENLIDEQVSRNWF